MTAGSSGAVRVASEMCSPMERSSIWCTSVTTVLTSSGRGRITSRRAKESSWWVRSLPRRAARAICSASLAKSVPAPSSTMNAA
jgi:hypothetical protein